MNNAQGYKDHTDDQRNIGGSDVNRESDTTDMNSTNGSKGGSSSRTDNTGLKDDGIQKDSDKMDSEM